MRMALEPFSIKPIDSLFANNNKHGYVDMITILQVLGLKSNDVILHKWALAVFGINWQMSF